MKKQVISLAVSMLLGLSQAQLYDHAKSDVAVYSKLNFEKQVSKNRDKGTSIVHYYNDDDQSKDMKGSFQQFATENKGIFRIGSVDCKVQVDICKKEKVETFPTMRIYPTFPAPTFDLDLTGQNFDVKVLKKQAGRFYSDKSIEITTNNHKTFVEEDVTIPKVLLFTNKKGTPFLYKALSQNFEKTLQFGIIRESEEVLASKYKIKKFPSIVIIKTDGKSVQYNEPEFNYGGIFDFINVHSQIFVDPSSKDNQVKQSSAAKPWLVVQVPEITKDSGNDVCLKKDGALCIVLVTKNKGELDEKHLDEMHLVSQNFASKISRGISFYFAWLSAEKEPEFADIFKIEEHPKIVILNPGRRKRFLIHQGEITEKSIETTLDKILGGDARFKAIKGNKMPDLVSLYDEGKVEEKKDL